MAERREGKLAATEYPTYFVCNKPMRCRLWLRHGRSETERGPSAVSAIQVASCEERIVVTAPAHGFVPETTSTSFNDRYKQLPSKGKTA
jgi:hypothetical protein